MDESGLLRSLLQISPSEPDPLHVNAENKTVHYRYIPLVMPIEIARLTEGAQNTVLNGRMAAHK
jgi:hypothetical protein